MLSMLEAVAKTERDLLVKRTQAGLARSKAAGRTLGRPTKTTDNRRAEIAAVRKSGASISALSRNYKISRGHYARNRQLVDPQNQRLVDAWRWFLVMAHPFTGN